MRLVFIFDPISLHSYVVKDLTIFILVSSLCNILLLFVLCCRYLYEH